MSYLHTTYCMWVDVAATGCACMRVLSVLPLFCLLSFFFLLSFLSYHRECVSYHSLVYDVAYSSAILATNKAISLSASGRFSSSFKSSQRRYIPYIPFHQLYLRWIGSNLPLTSWRVTLSGPMSVTIWVLPYELSLSWVLLLCLCGYVLLSFP